MSANICVVYSPELIPCNKLHLPKLKVLNISYKLNLLNEVSRHPRWLGGKESACQAGDVSLIPRSGRSTREGNGSAFQYSCLKIPIDRGTWQATVHGVAKSHLHLSD